MQDSFQTVNDSLSKLEKWKKANEKLTKKLKKQEEHLLFW